MPVARRKAGMPSSSRSDGEPSEAGSVSKMLNWARAATNITNDEMIPRMLITMSEGRNMARGLARSASNAPLMISMTLNGLSGMIPGFGREGEGLRSKARPRRPEGGGPAGVLAGSIPARDSRWNLRRCLLRTIGRGLALRLLGVVVGGRLPRLLLRLVSLIGHGPTVTRRRGVLLRPEEDMAPRTGGRRRGAGERARTCGDPRDSAGVCASLRESRGGGRRP